MRLTREDIFHAFARAGFGCDHSTASKWVGKNSADLATYFLKESVKATAFDLIRSDDPSLLSKKGLTKEERDKVERNSRMSQIDLNKFWLNKMILTDSGYIEKLTFFWHDHFATKVFNPWYIQKQLNTIRSLALGPFKNLLLAMVSDPAMLIFLNNQQNRAGAINENFAREFLELFTIGRGNYSETDIKETARALTGWRTDIKGNSRFEPRLYDNSVKTIFGKKGNFGAEEVIDLVLADKRTAKFIASKFYAFYISDDPDEKIINEMAEFYYKSDYDTSKLLVYIFSSDFFYQNKYHGARIKSPVELLVGIYRLVPVRYEGDDPNANLQRLMGQVLLFPPSVAGWSWGKAWIDSSSLLFRLELPAKILSVAYVDLAETERQMEPNDEARMMGGRALAKFKPFANWSKIESDLNGVSKNEKKNTLVEIMLRVKPKNYVVESIELHDQTSIKNAIIELMALPEYQLT